ncbi:MAG: hypothetical protein ACI30S_07085 [Muribaculaceae bacterium]
MKVTRRRRCAPCLVFTHDSSTSGAAGRGKSMQECSPMCNVDI